ncbi:hypothetical protein M433DRAFT_304798 [Acidomyces richmondensis BFW]|nr:MAG: hypothetical protein FE78DRAFT_483808 [Acidomyces sp. 'richmondensis']KYG49476.1 hypothetical protein M433DRAFT_304798 [Acidomyces richmondensis BFW]
MSALSDGTHNRNNVFFLKLTLAVQRSVLGRALVIVTILNLMTGPHDGRAYQNCGSLRRRGRKGREERRVANGLAVSFCFVSWAALFFISPFGRASYDRFSVWCVACVHSYVHILIVYTLPSETPGEVSLRV